MYIQTLFKPSLEFNNRLKALKEQGLEWTRAKLLLWVELGFALMEKLELDDEPVTAVWAILSGMPIRHPQLQSLTAEQRRAIANARQIIPYSARFTWLNALRDYIRDDRLANWRNYHFDIQNLDEQIINAAKELRHEAHQNIYERCLSAELEFRKRELKQAEAGVYYQFEAQTEDETVKLQINFTQSQVRTSYPLPWFNGVQARTPFQINIKDLEGDAVYLDNREKALARQYFWSDTAKSNWVRRFNKLNYHKVLTNIVEEKPAQILNLDGFTHIAGMVASGKSTFSLLLATHLINNYPNRRVTLVVGDTQSAIKLANQINWWFCDDPETNDPVAVPILGRSQRDKHLEAFSKSKDYSEHQERGQPHWGTRWLSVVCPLQGQISSGDRALLLVNSYEQAKWVADEIRHCWLSSSQLVYHLVPDTAEKYPDEYADNISKPGELNRADIESFGQTRGKILVAPMSAIGRGFNILNTYNKAAFGVVYFLTRPYPHPHDTQAIAQELNRRALEWEEKEDFVAWQQGDGIAQRAELVRKQANIYWRSVEQRSYYKTLRDKPDLCAKPR